MAALSDMVSTASAAVDGLDRASARFGQTIVDAFVKASAQGKSFESVVQSVGMKLLDLAAKQLAPDLQNSLSSGFDSFSGGVSAFAEGGVIATPSYFPTGAGQTALAGEAGPEAILPLTRGADGRLGLKGDRAPTVHVTINAQDLDSFKRSEQQISAALSRAVQRGRRSL